MKPAAIGDLPADVARRTLISKSAITTTDIRVNPHKRLYCEEGSYRDIEEHFNVPHDFILSEMLTGNWWKHLVAGGFAGAASRTCTAPLDRLRVYMQAYGSRGKGIEICLRSLLQEGGILSLWRGNGINVLKITPETGLKFWMYHQAKRVIRHKTNPSPYGEISEITIFTRFAAGSIAGAFSQTIIYPLEVLKTRFALSKTGENRSICQAIKKMYKTEGIRCFYRGYVPNILGIVPYAGIDLAIYETLKNKYLKMKEEQTSPSAYLLLSCGTVSSTSGQLFTYPLALIRTRLQAKIVDINAKSKDTMVSVFKDVIKAEGLRGLYRGIMLNFVKVVPAVGISYVVYEKISFALGIDMEI